MVILFNLEAIKMQIREIITNVDKVLRINEYSSVSFQVSSGPYFDEIQVWEGLAQNIKPYGKLFWDTYSIEKKFDDVVKILESDEFKKGWYDVVVNENWNGESNISEALKHLMGSYGFYDQASVIYDRGFGMLSDETIKTIMLNIRQETVRMDIGD